MDMHTRKAFYAFEISLIANEAMASSQKMYLTYSDKDQLDNFMSLVRREVDRLGNDIKNQRRAS